MDDFEKRCFVLFLTVQIKAARNTLVWSPFLSYLVHGGLPDVVLAFIAYAAPQEVDIFTIQFVCTGRRVLSYWLKGFRNPEEACLSLELWNVSDFLS